MTIDEKLRLSQAPICFISEGAFLRVYNQSFYVLQMHYSLSLKPIIRHIKKLDQTVIMAGLPAKSIFSYFADIEPAPFGYQLVGKFDLSNYYLWYSKQCDDYHTKFTRIR